MSSKIIGIDSGKAGWVIVRDGLEIIRTLPMPIRKVIDKKATTVFKYKDPKIVIKSGANKGQRQRVIKTKEKSHFELDERAIYVILNKYVNQGYKVAIEAQSGKKGNSAKASTTIDFNYGKMICILELLEADYKCVDPLKWKKHFELDIKNQVKKSLIEFCNNREMINYKCKEHWIVAPTNIISKSKSFFEKYKKQKSIDLAKKLGLKNITKHDEAEAFLIAQYYLEEIK